MDKNRMKEIASSLKAYLTIPWNTDNKGNIVPFIKGVEEVAQFDKVLADKLRNFNNNRNEIVAYLDSRSNDNKPTATT